MKRKSLVVLLLVLILAFVTAFAFACGGNNDQQTQKPDTDIEQGSDSDDNEDDKDPTVHTHSPQFTAAKDATCTTDGNIAYWYCAGCNKYFNDEDCTEEITSGITVAATHHLRLPLTKHDRKEASCTENGNILYYECQDCHKYFDSETATNEIPQNDIVLPAGHKFPATYQTNETEHWKKCENCPQEDERGLHQYGEDNECEVCGYVRDFTAGLQYENIDGKTCKVTGIGDATTETDIIIPATHDGRKVVEIANFAFSENNGNVQSITIPESVTKIGQYVFDGCTKLSEVIWNAANCTQVGGTNTTLFHGCTSVKSIVVGENVQRLPKGVFDGCSSLLSITLPFVGSGTKSNEYFGYIFGANSYSENKDKVPSSLASAVITGGEEIAAHAFDGCAALTNISITGNVTSIGEGAFNGCKNLNKAEIPDSVVFVDSSAFSKCDNLTYTEYRNAKYIGNDDNPYVVLVKANDTSVEICSVNEKTRIISDEAFRSCANLAEISIPASVRHIGNNAFYGCYGVQTITFGNDSELQVIGNYAFYGCDLVKKITIPASVTSIEDSAFYYSDGLQTLAFEDNSRLQSIGNYAFYGCENLQKITFGDNCELKYIGDYAFSKCIMTEFIIPEKVVSIGKYAFNYCENLIEITIPASVTSIGNYAFDDCYGLVRAEADPNSTSFVSQDGILYNYEKTSFVCVPKLISGAIVIPAGITSISSNIFYNHYNIQSVSFENGSLLRYISSDAFHYCSNLTEIAIPKSVISIGDRAFQSCKNLQTVTFESNSELQSIGDDAFRDCDKLTSITIPANVASIGRYAFWLCSNLQNVTFEDPNGWNVSKDSDMSSSMTLSSESLKNETTAAKYLLSTYWNYYWKKG